MTVKVDFSFSIRALEEQARDLGNARMTHTLELIRGYGTGTSINTFDRCYSDTDTPAGAVKTYDLMAGVSSLVTGSAISFVELCGIFIRNLSTTPGHTLSIGAGSNPITGLWGASGDLIKLGPGGLFAWWDPIDGINPVAGTGDVLTIDPGANTIPLAVVFLGRSAQPS